MSGYVYLIGPTDWRYGRVKIGRTIGAPAARLSALQTGCPFDLQVYGYFRGGVELERVLHATFAPLRERGEWFRLDGKLLDVVSNVTAETYGRVPVEPRCLYEILDECVVRGSYTDHLTADEIEQWSASANIRPLSAWLASAYGGTIQ